MAPRKAKEAAEESKANACLCRNPSKNVAVVDGKDGKIQSTAVCYDVVKAEKIAESKASLSLPSPSSSIKKKSHLLSSKVSNDVFGIHVLGFLDRPDIHHCMCVGKFHTKFHIKDYYCPRHGSRLESQTKRRQRLRRENGDDDTDEGDDAEDNDGASATEDDEEQHHLGDAAEQMYIDDYAENNMGNVSEEKATENKTPKIECEDCVEGEFGNERCPVCQRFENSMEEIVECDGCDARWCLPRCDMWPRGICDVCGSCSCGSDADKQEQGCIPVDFCQRCDTSFCCDCRPFINCQGCDDDFICFDCFMEDGYYCACCSEAYHYGCEVSFFCVECEEPYCYECKDSFFCGICEERLCESCRKNFFCNECEASHCYSCAKPCFCMECSFVSCSEACTFFTCDECETSTCFHCCTKSYACPDCGKEICADCQGYFKVCCCEKKGVFAVKRN